MIATFAGKLKGKKIRLRCDNKALVVALSKGRAKDEKLAIVMRLIVDELADKDAQHVIGTIQYSYTAFQWDDASLTRYSSLMKVLNDAMKVASAPRARINWDEACKNACIELHDHIVNRPLAYCPSSQ